MEYTFPRAIRAVWHVSFIPKKGLNHGTIECEREWVISLLCDADFWYRTEMRSAIHTISGGVGESVDISAFSHIICHCRRLELFQQLPRTKLSLLLTYSRMKHKSGCECYWLSVATCEWKYSVCGTFVVILPSTGFAWVAIVLPVYAWHILIAAVNHHDLA